MEKQTKTVKLTKTAAEVVLVCELTGGDIMDLEASGMGSDMRADQRGVRIDAASAYKLRLKKLVELIVVSFNGNKDRDFCWNSVRNLPRADYDQLMQEINLINSGADPEGEKKIEE